MTNINTNTPNAGQFATPQGSNTFGSDASARNLSGLDALMATPAFTFAGASDLKPQGLGVGEIPKTKEFGEFPPFQMPNYVKPTNGSVVSDAKWDPLGDDDGDGIQNQYEQITVTANGKVDFSGDFYGRYDGNAKAWMIWEDDLFFDDFMGWFTPGTKDNHNFVTKDSDWSVGTGGGVTVPSGAGVNNNVTGGTSGGPEDYWIRVPPPPPTGQ